MLVKDRSRMHRAPGRSKPVLRRGCAAPPRLVRRPLPRALPWVARSRHISMQKLANSRKTAPLLDF